MLEEDEEMREEEDVDQGGLLNYLYFVRLTMKLPYMLEEDNNGEMRDEEDVDQGGLLNYLYFARLTMKLPYIC